MDLELRSGAAQCLHASAQLAEELGKLRRRRRWHQPCIVPGMLSENRLPPESLNAPEQPSPEAAWHGVFSGRYRIAAWYDRGGRRYLVAKPQSAEDDTGLTVRQRRLLAMRLRGTALKVMAMEHGLSIGTISRDLTVAMERLGLASVSDLAAVLGHVGR